MKKIAFIALFLTCSSLLFAQQQNLNIIYIGDSITQGTVLADPETGAPPAIASAYLREQAGVVSVEFSNMGRSGFTTVDFLPSTGKAFNEVEEAANVFASKPGLMIFSIMLGTNDSAMKGPNGAPVSPDAYFSNLKAIIDRLLKDYPGCRIIIHEPIWYSPNTYNSSKFLKEGLDRLKKYSPEIRKLAESYAKNNKDKVFLGDISAFGYFKKNYLASLQPENGHEGIFYLHPNQDGAVELGHRWGKAIYRMLNRIK